MFTMRSLLCFWLLSRSWFGYAFVITRSPPQPTKTIKRRAVDAIIPTSIGQIGVNPVLLDLGDADTYVGEIYGTDTQYITVVDTTTSVR
jgi:hypothetical protein